VSLFYNAPEPTRGRGEGSPYNGNVSGDYTVCLPFDTNFSIWLDTQMLQLQSAEISVSIHIPVREFVFLDRIYNLIQNYAAIICLI